MRRCLRLIVAGLLLCASPSWAAIAVEAATSCDSGSTLVTSLSCSVTVPGSLSNSILVVGIAQSGNVSTNDHVSSVTFNTTETLTREGTAGQSSAARVYLYYLVNPTATTANVTVTGDGTNLRLVVGAVVLSGVDQTTPFGTGAGASSAGSNGPATVNVSTSAGDLVIDIAAKRNTTEALTVGADQTQRANDQSTHATADNNVIGGMSTEPHNTGTTTMSWSWTTASRSWAIRASPLKEASAGGAATRRRVIIIQ